MSTDRHDPLDADERELARVLRALPAGEPPSALDARILAMARDAVVTTPAQKDEGQPRARRAPLLPHRPPLAGVLRHAQSHRDHLRRCGLSSARNADHVAQPLKPHLGRLKARSNETDWSAQLHTPLTFRLAQPTKFL